MGKGRKNGWLGNVLRKVALFVIVMLLTFGGCGSFLFGEDVLAVSCTGPGGGTNAAIRRACTQTATNNPGAAWINGSENYSESTTAEFDDVSPTDDETVTVYMHGILWNASGLGWDTVGTYHIQLCASPDSSQSMSGSATNQCEGGTAADYVIGNADYFSRGEATSEWSKASNDSGYIDIDVKKFTNGISKGSDGYYTRTIYIARCANETCGGDSEYTYACDSSEIKIKFNEPKYRIRKFTYYKDETKTNTGTDTNTYSASSTATITSNGSSPTNSSGTYIGSNNRVPTNGEASSTGGTATMTLYDRIRKSVKIGFVENITKSFKDVRG